MDECSAAISRAVRVITETAVQNENNIHSELVAAFCSLTRAVDGKSSSRNEQKSNLKELKKSHTEQSNELKRLDETLAALQAAEEEEQAQSEASFAEGGRDIAALDDSLEYWTTIYNTMRKVFRVTFRCSDPVDHTKVTFGFFRNKKDVPRTTLFLTEDPSLEAVDLSWTNLKQVHEERPKRPFVERFDKNSGPL